MGLDDNAMTIYIQAFCCFQFKPEDHSLLLTLERIASHEMGEGPMRKVLVQEGRAKILLRVLWSVMTKENTLDKELDCILSTLTSITSKLSDHIPEMLQVNFLDEHPPLAVAVSLAAQRQLCRGSTSSFTTNIIQNVLFMLR